MPDAAETLLDNAAWAGAAARLSVLVPFRGDDPTPLLAALDREAVPAEVVVLDDGTGDDLLAQRVADTVRGMRLPARFVRLASNEGRARGRNRLVRHARAGHLLFLDSDMLPDDPRFLAAWLELVDAGDPPVAFGGFSLQQVPPRRDLALHRALAGRTDCIPAAARRRDPAKNLFTSNLLVRRDVFHAEAFDERFTGWGWEDVEWGIRVGRRWPILHVDNTITHLGLDPAPVIATKFEQSAANFSRLVAAHPEAVSTYPCYRAARMLRRVPLRGLWRTALKRYAVGGAGPVRLRAFAMRCYRAALYAEVV